jgi:general secretion pathway protein K
MIAALLRPRRRTADGFVIVAVLWILGALATLASIYAVYVIDTATAFRAHDDVVEAEGLASAAIELTALQMTARPDVPRPSNGAFNFRIGSGQVSVQFRSEAARIDLNAAPKELLAGLFAGLGARGEDARNYADRVVGWRTKPTPGQDVEASLYQMAGRRYVPRGAPFEHPGELWLVHGLPEALVERAMPLVTVYSGQAQVNVLDAPPGVIAALPGMTPDALHAFLAQRAMAPQNGQILLSLLGGAGTHASIEPTKTTRATIRVNLDNGRQITSETVVFIGDNDNEPYRVLSWRDGLDE